MTVEEALLQTGKNLSAIRTAKGWSVEALAVLSGVAEATIAGIEAGSVNYWVADIFSLATALNVDFRRIMVDNITI